MVDIGGIGESLLKQWCHQVGISPNKSESDKAGWDFRLDFPAPDIASLKEVHGSAIQCLVQVKTTKTKRNSIAIKLSNLRRFATIPQPAFFLIIRLSESLDPETAYLVHMTDDLMRKTLEKVAEKHNDDLLSQLHKSTLSIHFMEEHELASLDGSALSDAILKYIPDGPHVYSASKIELLEKLGFESEFGKFNFITKGKDSLKELIEVSLGKRDKVEIFNTTTMIERFGIPDKKPLVTAEKAWLSMPGLHPTKTGRIFIGKSELTPAIELPASCYVSPVAMLLEENVPTVRIDAQFLELIIDRKFRTGRVTLNVAYETRYPYTILKKYAAFLRMLEDSDGAVLLRFDFGGTLTHESPVRITLDPTSESLHDAPELEIIERLDSLLKYYNLNTEIETSIKDLLRAGDRITQMDLLTSGKAKGYRAEFTVSPDEEAPKQPTAYITLASASVANYMFAIAMVLTGASKKEAPGLIVLDSEDMTIKERLAFKIPNQRAKKEIRNIINRISQEYEDTHCVVLDRDLF